MSEDPYDKISKRYAEGLQKSMEDCLTGFNRMADNARKLIDEQAEERMKEDKELLELAAKAAGYTLDEQMLEKGWAFCKELHGYWNPLEDNEDAFVLAVKLGLCIYINRIRSDGGDSPEVTVYYGGLFKDKKIEMWTGIDDDYYEAARRAIVLAAAEIGRSLG